MVLLALRALPALAGLLVAVGAPAQSSLPQPRVAYEMHSARINQIRATPDFLRLVTVSQDKTLRVWRAADLALMRVIAVPSEGGEEGSLRSLAITPDGREVIVGGWTGLAWTGGRQAQAYRFDLATGRLLQVLRGFPAIIESMAISADGRRLAIGLGGAAGLRVLDWPSGRELWADREYGERVGFADFAVDGTLATTSADGCLRLYSPEGRLVFRAEYPPRPDPGPACRGSALGGVRFSPDGRRLAFGLQDRVEIVVMDVATRSVVQRLRVDDPAQRSLCCPNWSVDGTRLHMHGAYGGDGPTPLYRVTLASGAIERLPVGRQRFTNVLPLPDGELLVSTTAPSLARIGRDGSVVAEMRPPNGDFRFAWDQWRLDPGGTRVLLPMDPEGRDRRLFTLDAPPERAFRPAVPGDETGLQPPRRDGGLPVEAWLDEYGYQRPVRVAGQPLRLKAFQSVRSWAADARRAVLGTQWSVLMTDASARIVWEQDLPAPAYQVTLSGDGRFIVVAVGDGTLRWYAAEDGREVLGLFLHLNGSDWIAWRPDGTYASSPGGDAFLGWLVNRGDEREPLLLRAVQFERSLYQPALVRAALSAVAPPGAASLSETLARLAAPEVRIEGIDEARREVRFRVRPAGRPAREVGVFADGIPVLGPAERRLPGGLEERVGTVVIPLGLPLDRVRVEAESDSAVGLDETAVLRPAKAAAGRGRLWVLAIGVERFDDFAGCGQTRNCPLSLPELPNAPSDAGTMAAVLREHRPADFADVRTTVVAHRLGRTPDKATIVSALQELQAARPEDTVLVFLASHGFAAGSGKEYYFAPSDARAAALAQVTATDAGDAPAPSLLSATELTDALRRVAGRRILVIDTCFAGAAGVSRNPYSVAKRSAAASFATLSASSSEELSIEYIDPDVPHGAFTWALLRGLRGAADADGDGRVTLEEAFAFVGPEVRRNTDLVNAAARRYNPRHVPLTQTPVLYSIGPLRTSVLSAPRRTTGAAPR